jgi:hypothetical protein
MGKEIDFVPIISRIPLLSLTNEYASSSSCAALLSIAGILQLMDYSHESITLFKSTCSITVATNT